MSYGTGSAKEGGDVVGDGSMATASGAKKSNGSGKTIMLVLSIVLGAGTLIGATTSVIGWSEARKATKVEAELADFKKTDYQPFKEDQKELKGKILEALKNLADNQEKMNQLLLDHMQRH
jgi:hypothetical protein